MATYNFKKDTKLYVVYGGFKYLLDVYPGLNASQTFDETTVRVKTLHTQNQMFDSAVITKANPANFDFTIPVLDENHMNVVFDLLIDYDSTSTEVTLKTCDLYIQSSSEVYKLEKAVIERGIFQIPRNGIITLNISGSASKLYPYVGTIPGTLVSAASRTYNTTATLGITIGGATQENVVSVSIELSNEVSWNNYDTLHKSLNVTSSLDSQYPESFVVSGRVLSGNIQEYVTSDNNEEVNQWSIGEAIIIDCGPIIFNLPQVVFTNRLDMQEIFVQSYDFRMISNPSNLKTVINKV